MNSKTCKCIAALVLSTAVTGTLSACQQPGKSEAAVEAEQPELKIGVDIIKPFFYKDENGEYTGIDAEIARAACDTAGYEPVFVEIPWDEKDTYLEKGTVDCLWNAFSEDGREDSYLWTVPYLESNLDVLVEENCPDQSLKKLRSKGGIAVRAGSKVEEILLDDVDNSLTDTENVYSCGSFLMAETAFIKGYAGALACHEAVLQNIMDDYPGSYRILDDSLMTVHLGVAFAKDRDSADWEKINSALKDLKENGTISAIGKKYNMSTADTEEVTSDDEN